MEALTPSCGAPELHPYLGIDLLTGFDSALTQSALTKGVALGDIS